MKALKRLQNGAVTGFSLLETALALAVMGLVAAGLVALLQQFRNRQQVQLTRTNQERILHALGHYIARHGRLPCPADPGFALTGSMLSGEAMRGCHASPKRIQGYVPFKTLGLPRKVALNGHGVPLTYVVNPVLTRPPPEPVSSKRLWCSHKRRHILLTDVRNDNGDPVAVILISHARKTKWKPAGELKRDGSWVFSTALRETANMRIETAANLASYYAQMVCSPSGS